MLGARRIIASSSRWLLARPSGAAYLSGSGGFFSADESPSFTTNSRTSSRVRASYCTGSSGGSVRNQRRCPPIISSRNDSGASTCRRAFFSSKDGSDDEHEEEEEEEEEDDEGSGVVAGSDSDSSSDAADREFFQQQAAAAAAAVGNSIPSAFFAQASAHYDLVVVGSGPAAQKCALESARMGKKVAVVDKGSMVGGVCVHTGTIPSKTFREACLHLTGFLHQGFYGRMSAMKKHISMPDILMVVRKVEHGETAVIDDQLRREGVDLISGTARFIPSPEGDHKRVVVLRDTKEGDKEERTSVYRHFTAGVPAMTLSSEKFLVACGTRPARPDHIPFDGQRVFDSDQILWGGVKEVPRDLIVVGAGVIGMEYASMINILPGTTVTIIDPRDEVLGFADKEVVQALAYAMRKSGARFLLGETVQSVERQSGTNKVVAVLSTGKRVVGDALLYTMGRQGNSDSVGLESVGIEVDKRGLIQVNDYYQAAEDVYACGDIIGYPALASTSTEQGRRAALHMWRGASAVTLDDDMLDYSSRSGSDQGGGQDGGMVAVGGGEDQERHTQVKTVDHETWLGRDSEQLFPYGIYTVPEISMVGKTEAQLTAEGVNYEVGVANFEELAKGQMLGGADGFLKIIFHAETLKLLGVHCFGDGATEIIHIGQVLMSQGGTIKYFESSVFNYPTRAEAYNVAAHDGLRKVGRAGVDIVP